MLNDVEREAVGCKLKNSRTSQAKLAEDDGG